MVNIPACVSAFWFCTTFFPPHHIFAILSLACDPACATAFHRRCNGQSSRCLCSCPVFAARFPVDKTFSRSPLLHFTASPSSYYELISLIMLLRLLLAFRTKAVHLPLLSGGGEFRRVSSIQTDPFHYILRESCFWMPRCLVRSCFVFLLFAGVKHTAWSC